MWPKAFAQLIELAPHISRLLPLADRFFQSKAVADDGSRQAMEAMAEGLRGDVGQVTAAHAGLYKQMHDLSGSLEAVNTGLREQVTALNSTVGTLGAKIESTAGDVRGARLAAESVEARLTRIEARQGRLFSFFAIVFVMLAAVLVLLAILVSHAR